MKETVCTCRFKIVLERVWRNMEFRKFCIKGIICMKKWAYVGTSFVGRWCWNEMCTDVDGCDVDRSHISCDIRRAHVQFCELFIICGHGHMCEGKGVCLPMHSVWRRNSCSSQRRRILVFCTWTNEEQDCVFWVAPKLVWVCCYVQYPNATCQYYEEGPMGGNLTVCNF